MVGTHRARPYPTTGNKCVPYISVWRLLIFFLILKKYIYLYNRCAMIFIEKYFLNISFLVTIKLEYICTHKKVDLYNNP